VVPIPTYGKGFTGYGRPVMPSIGTGTGGMNPTPMPGQPGVTITGTGSKFILSEMFCLTLLLIQKENEYLLNGYTNFFTDVYY
jgi:hypothetical protein